MQWSIQSFRCCQMGTIVRCCLIFIWENEKNEGNTQDNSDGCCKTSSYTDSGNFELCNNIVQKRKLFWEYTTLVVQFLKTLSVNSLPIFSLLPTILIGTTTKPNSEMTLTKVKYIYFLVRTTLKFQMFFYVVIFIFSKQVVLKTFNIDYTKLFLVTSFNSFSSIIALY